MPDVTLNVLIPVKAFTRAKGRLAPALSATERAALARSMATRVVEATGTLATWIVCDDDEVAAWADELGVAVSWQPGRGLNGAISAATAERFDAGATRVAVVHGDLPLASSLHWLDAAGDDIVLVADRHRTGTNVLSTPTPGFRFAYGAGSLKRHIAEARRLGLEVRLVHDHSLEWDIDVPADLAALDEPTTRATS